MHYYTPIKLHAKSVGLQTDPAGIHMNLNFTRSLAAYECTMIYVPSMQACSSSSLISSTDRHTCTTAQAIEIFANLATHFFNGVISSLLLDPLREK